MLATGPVFAPLWIGDSLHIKYTLPEHFCLSAKLFERSIIYILLFWGHRPRSLRTMPLNESVVYSRVED